MGRMIFGGSPDATEADPDAAERAFQGDPQMAATFALMKADYEHAQGVGHWRRYLHLFFERDHPIPGLHLRRLPLHHRTDPDPDR